MLKDFELARYGRGRRAYVAWLESRVAKGGMITPEATKALKQGWCLGPEGFRDRLLGLLDDAKEIRRKGSQAGETRCEHGVADAERLLRQALPASGLPTEPKELAALRKSDPRKAVVAILLRKRTAVSTGWIAERLAMGHASTVSRLAKDEASRGPLFRKLEQIIGAGCQGW